MTTIGEIANVLKQSKSAVIFTHMRPDGDTLGCGMALSRALSLCGVRSEVVNEAPIPPKFFFLEGMREIGTRPSLNGGAVIAVDTSDASRLGRLEEVWRARAKKQVSVNIDHHISNTRFAAYNFVRERASNAENVFALIDALQVPLTAEIADFLMLGMITDSGGLSHSDVDGETLRCAARAADGGARLSEITYEMLRRRSKAQAGLYAETVSRLRYLLEDRLVVAFVPQERLEKYGLGPDATEGLVDFGLSVDCVEVSACLLEVKRGQYKVSLRSKGKVNVNEVARTFGGGGHILASGCMLFGEFEEALDRLRYAVFQHMEDA